MKYMAQPGAPPAAWQGPLFNDQAKTNSTIRLEHKYSDTPRPGLEPAAGGVALRLPHELLRALAQDHQVTRALSGVTTRPPS